MEFFVTLVKGWKRSTKVTRSPIGCCTSPGYTSDLNFLFSFSFFFFFLMYLIEFLTSPVFSVLYFRTKFTNWEIIRWFWCLLKFITGKQWEYSREIFYFFSYSLMNRMITLTPKLPISSGKSWLLAYIKFKTGAYQHTEVFFGCTLIYNTKNDFWRPVTCKCTNLNQKLNFCTLSHGF